MKKFFFTYGQGDTMPFRAGWTVIEANTREDAIALFDIVHPRRGGKDGLVNCAGIYDEKYFKANKMYWEGNFGAFEVERISIKVAR